MRVNVQSVAGTEMNDRTPISRNLEAYVLATLGANNDLVIASMHNETRTWWDAGLHVTEDVARHTFRDGVVIVRTVEYDDEESPGASCAVEWITYDVASCPPSIHVHPKRKTFDSLCRESFWAMVRGVRMTSGRTTDPS